MTEPTFQTAVDICRKVFEFDADPQTPEELERTLERYAGLSIHSCSHRCQRPACVARRERDELQVKLDAAAAMLERYKFVGYTDEALQQLIDNPGANNGDIYLRERDRRQIMKTIRE